MYNFFLACVHQIRHWSNMKNFDNFFNKWKDYVFMNKIELFKSIKYFWKNEIYLDLNCLIKNDRSSDRIKIQFVKITHVKIITNYERHTTKPYFSVRSYQLCFKLANFFSKMQSFTITIKVKDPTVWIKIRNPSSLEVIDKIKFLKSN